MTREEFMDIVYSELHSDGDNYRANRIIDAADEYADEYAEEQTGWIPVSERLPEDNTLVLVTVKVGNREPKVRSGYYYMNGHFHIDNGDCWEAMDKELIAWMPLPTPPNKSEILTVTESEG